MTLISHDGDALDERFTRHDALVDALDETLGAFPAPVDGGAAAEYISGLFQSALEGMANLADAHRAFIAIARDVSRDLASNDDEAARALNELRESF